MKPLCPPELYQHVWRIVVERLEKMSKLWCCYYKSVMFTGSYRNSLSYAFNRFQYFSRLGDWLLRSTQLLSLVLVPLVPSCLAWRRLQSQVRSRVTWPTWPWPRVRRSRQDLPRCAKSLGKYKQRPYFYGKTAITKEFVGTTSVISVWFMIG